jgi:hypothetical protein
MRRILSTMSSCCVLVILTMGGSGAVSAQVPDAQTKAKLDAIKKQLADLQKKIDALREQEQKLLLEAKNRAEEKDYYSKITVDIKGRLSKTTDYGGYGAAKETWVVTAKSMTWQLDFAGKKEWLDLAKQLDGKTVLITGTASFSTTTATITYPPGWGGAYGSPGLLGGYPSIPGAPSPGLPGGPSSWRYPPYPGGFGSPYPTTVWTVTVETFKAPPMAGN